LEYARNLKFGIEVATKKIF